MLPYIGGKKRMQNWIIPFIPYDTETYIEIFAGQFWIFFGIDLVKYPRLKNIIYNDSNPLNSNLFRCVKEDHKLLLDECDKILVQEKGKYPTDPKCSENFYKFQKEIYLESFKINSGPNYEIAAKYAYVLSQVFSGANPSSAKFIDLRGKYQSKFTSFKNKLRDPKWQIMFESITKVENLDFENVISKYDSEKTFIYSDPPYFVVGEGNYYSNHEFGTKDHERLANCLKSIEGKFAMSYYYFPQLEEWFPKDQYRWESREYSKAAMASKGRSQTKATELLIMNY